MSMIPELPERDDGLYGATDCGGGRVERDGCKFNPALVVEYPAPPCGVKDWLDWKLLALVWGLVVPWGEAEKDVPRFGGLGKVSLNKVMGLCGLNGAELNEWPAQCCLNGFMRDWLRGLERDIEPFWERVERVGNPPLIVPCC